LAAVDGAPEAVLRQTQCSRQGMPHVFSSAEYSVAQDPSLVIAVALAEDPNIRHRRASDLRLGVATVRRVAKPVAFVARCMPR
jgi:hypothetical protein